MATIERASRMFGQCVCEVKPMYGLVVGHRSSIIDKSIGSMPIGDTARGTLVQIGLSSVWIKRDCSKRTAHYHCNVLSDG